MGGFIVFLSLLPGPDSELVISIGLAAIRLAIGRG
jgi:hypothetical protein